jgi:hypothetical protein
LEGMVCPGGLSAPLPKRGFFLSRVDPALGLPCPSEEACLGGSHSGSASNASCSPGYAGNRCARCTDGNYLLYNRCKQCGIPAVIWIFSVGLPIVAIIGELLMLCASWWLFPHVTRWLFDSCPASSRRRVAWPGPPLGSGVQTDVVRSRSRNSVSERVVPSRAHPIAHGHTWTQISVVLWHLP